MAAHRSNQDMASKEAEKNADKACKAAHRSNQDLAVQEAEKAATRARKVAEQQEIPPS